MYLLGFDLVDVIHWLMMDLEILGLSLRNDKNFGFLQLEYTGLMT